MSTSEEESPDDVKTAWPLLKLGLTLIAMIIPVFFICKWWQKREDGDVSLDEILASEANKGISNGEVETSDDPLEAIKTLPWPNELPGLEKIIIYEELKEKILNKIEYDEISSDMLSDDERMKLRHALMDRCQSHVVWLLRLEREQRSMDRMSRRGMVSAADYAAFSHFAELLDAEVNEVRAEAAWLSDDEAKSRQAAEEIWRIAVQIWHQRQQQQQVSQQDQLKEKEKLEGKKAQARAAQAKKSLKGLKGGFLDNANKKETKSNIATTKKNNDPQEKQKKEQRFQTTQWPPILPNARQREIYERMKKDAIETHNKTSSSSGNTGKNYHLPENDIKQQLRQVLMERCQALIPLLRAIDAEKERYRAAVDRSRWGSENLAPTAEDWGRLEQIGNLAATERRLVEEEADWLGDREGKVTNMGEQIWSMAYQSYMEQRGAAEKHKQNETKRVLQAYAAGNAKPWPKQLPGTKQREDYERLKSSFLNNLSSSSQAAIIQGKPVAQVIGADGTKQFRSALMLRCQQLVPLIIRLDLEARGTHMAAEKGHVPENEYQQFKQLEDTVKHEMQLVKQEAAWISGDANTAEHIWQMAIHLYNQRRAEIAKQLEIKRQQAQAPSPSQAPAQVVD